MNKPVTAQDIMSQSRREPASQATRIEQSRAVAEVQAAYTIAKQFPRDETVALERALSACRTWDVADVAFYKYKRGDGTVSDASIRLAIELARCWGNINYGIMELDRDDDRKVSEMLAYAVDLETNAQSRTTFLNPHKRDTRNGAKLLVDMRDIYENNANMGARRLRERIFDVLPGYLKEAAKSACREVLERGQGDQPMQVRIAEAIKAFDEIGISKARLEAKLGGSSSWTAIDVANLKISYRSISREEVGAEDEFPRIGIQEATEAAKRLIDSAATAAERAEPETGRADAEHGDQHDGTHPDHPARKVADEIKRAAEASPNIEHLAQLRGLRGPDIAAMPDDLGIEAVRALDEAEKRLGGKNA